MYDQTTNKDPGQNYLAHKTPSLCGNNSEFSAKEVNLIRSGVLTAGSLHHLNKSMNFLQKNINSIKRTISKLSMVFKTMPN